MPRTGKGKGSESKRKRGRIHHHAEPRNKETAPHILAALEAQRARASQQSLVPPAQQTPAASTAEATQAGPAPPPPPPPPPLPGYLFDPARNRFFRVVKDSVGTPGNINNRNDNSETRRKLKIPIVVGRNERSRPPPPPPPPQRTGESRVNKWGNNSNINNNDNNTSSTASSAAAHAGGLTSTVGTYAAAAAAADPGVARAIGSWSSTTGGGGLHSYAMNSRRGLWGSDSRTHRSRAVVPAGPAQNRRAGVESIVSSSRFRLRSLLSWAHRAPGAAYSAIDWDAGRGVVAVGTNSGALGVMMTRHSSPMSGGGGGAGGDRPLRGFAPGRGGMQEEEGEERVCWTAAASRSCSQVSDVKFRTHGNEWACVTASLGCAGQPGGVHARFWREGEQEGTPDVVDIFSSARVLDKKLRRGSVWCTEWDPLTPARLAIGPSSCCPVAFFDVENQMLLPVAQLSSDVFSMSFLPAAAPGAGHALVCGLRDGSVVLVDSRQPPRHNGTTRVANGLIGGGSGGGGGHYRNAKVGGRNRSGGGGYGGHGPTLFTTKPLARLDCSSIDHTHILRDGTRCLVKDRSGGLQTVDLRFFAGQGQGSGRGRGQARARPLKVLVPPRKPGRTLGTRAPTPGRFALDPTETIVATPVPAAAAAAAAAAAIRGGRDSSGLAAGLGAPVVSGGGAWGAFSSSGTAALYQQTAGTGYRHPSGRSGDVHGVGFDTNGGGGGDDGDTDALFPGRDRLRILNVSSGRVLNDIQTPWKGMSLARGAGATIGGGQGSPSGILQLWGTAWEPERGAGVFQARLRCEPNGGYGRL